MMMNSFKDQKKKKQKKVELFGAVLTWFFQEFTFS